MPSRLHSILLLLLLAAFASCNQLEEETKLSIPKIKKITSIQEGRKDAEVSFEYDAAGRLIKESFSDSYSIVYTYAPGKVIEQVYGINKKLTATTTLIVNEKGLLIANGDHTTYEYNPDGYLVKRTVNVTEHSFQIENGNTVQESVMNIGDEENIRIVAKHEFLPHSINTIGFENMGLAFYGKQNRELVVREQGIPPAYTASWTYEYVLDSKKRVSKRKIQNGITNIYTYYE